MEAFDECDKAHIQEAIASTDELRSDNRSARPNAIDATGNLNKILERQLAHRSKQTTSLLIPPIFFITRSTSRRRCCLRLLTTSELTGRSR